MPIYEFRCRSCEVVFEKLVRNSSQPVTCRDCGSEDLQKLISAHAIGTGAPDTACGSAPCSPAPACGGGACPACF
ncbi:zinc ribbon domain-containing protein [Mariprofundus erugo]|uniref:FmdB family zinc ribbon protein n=1 Tax=Mariprofundus erugo TaxID=2528639 RepID=UPI0010FF3F63|nr:zinc ribbon domain-containing protein [Mariprofundus erugo]TLS77142.1 zinc ribbon domain-containing protein [Mariprofundus erugo]